MTKRKPKPMTTDLDTARVLRGVFGVKIMNDITIMDNKIFVSTTENGGEKDGSKSDSNV